MQSQTAEIILLEDQSQPLPSPSPLDGVTDTQKTFNAAGETMQRVSDRLSGNGEGYP